MIPKLKLKIYDKVHQHALQTLRKFNITPISQYCDLNKNGRVFKYILPDAGVDHFSANQRHLKIVEYNMKQISPDIKKVKLATRTKHKGICVLFKTRNIKLVK